MLKGNAGDLIAMLKYAACLELGRGIEQDEETALLVYEEAARLGSAVAMNNIGEMIREGRGRDKDATFAASWFRCVPRALLHSLAGSNAEVSSTNSLTRADTRRGMVVPKR